MGKEFFKASDFTTLRSMGEAKALADHANSILKERGRVVYGFTERAIFCGFSEQTSTVDTHRALLVCIEKIEKAPCAHFGINDIKIDGTRGYHCFHCGENLKPTKWELAE